MTQIYLVPGFFGFTALGTYNYFHRVSDTLAEALAAHGIDAEIIEVETLPTGSIRRRAIRLIDIVLENGGLDHHRLHFIGHSTGGLDIRMLLTPGVRLREGKEEIEIAKRTRSAITLSTPHYGTPMANFFTGLNGRNLLALLTLMATSGPGRYTIYSFARLLNQYARIDRFFGMENNILDSVAENLLAQIRPDRGEALWEYLRKISTDQGAMIQLTPEGMDLFNGAAPDRSGIDYVSFVSVSPPPDRKLMIPGFSDPYRAFTHWIYSVCYQITRREHRQYPYPQLDATSKALAESALDFPLDGADNDGVVPALSQFWGRTASVVSADHLDVVGQFQHLHRGSTYTTWLHSGSGFNEEVFRRLWGDIAGVIRENEPAGRKRKKMVN